ncbi:hypothetical protein TRVA0_010S03268 [Trichomonascus vanleenenianus]|uniref:cytochrome b5-like heme/steroid binding domain-containing protein n=1 Tax=Trichomonascus vanleenenianus TaxID=2268995 RepID=UPI003EC9F447
MSELRQRKIGSKEKAENIVEDEEVSSKPSIVDILKIVVSVLFIQIALSFYITGTATWGYETRWTNPRYVQFRLIGRPVSLTEDQLARHDGSDPALPIYVAIDGKVYDVSSNPGMYGPGGSYSFFSGRDAARAYVTGCFTTDLTHDLRGLDEEEASKGIAGWQQFYDNSHKYWYVGTVEHPPLTGDPPAPCKKGAQAPQGVLNSHH